MLHALCTYGACRGGFTTPHIPQAYTVSFMCQCANEPIEASIASWAFQSPPGINSNHPKVLFGASLDLLRGGGGGGRFSVAEPEIFLWNTAPWALVSLFVLMLLAALEAVGITCRIINTRRRGALTITVTVCAIV